MEPIVDNKLREALDTVDPESTLIVLLTLPFVPCADVAIDPLLSRQEQRQRRAQALSGHMQTAYGDTQDRLRAMGLDVPARPSRVLIAAGPARLIQEALNTFTFDGASLNRVVPFQLTGE